MAGDWREDNRESKINILFSVCFFLTGAAATSLFLLSFVEPAVPKAGQQLLCGRWAGGAASIAVQGQPGIPVSLTQLLDILPAGFDLIPAREPEALTADARADQPFVGFGGVDPVFQ